MMFQILVPNQFAKRAAEREDLERAHLARHLPSGIGRVSRDSRLRIRGAQRELVHERLRHLITDTIDTAVLAVLLFTGPHEGKRFVDVSENALYWYFVVLSWLPIYAVIYWVPRY